MYYRRKIMLALLESSGGSLGRLKLQKLLFLVSQHQESPAFDFVPYKYGAYSFRATADAGTLRKYGLLNSENGKVWDKITQEKYLPQLKKRDQQIVKTIALRFGRLSGRELIEYTYSKYPYYAINSLIADRYLDEESLAEIKSQLPILDQPALFTIGYEGISLETYFNRLIKNKVNALIDVRQNAVSMKYGFSKSTLSYVCGVLGIAYFHVPEVGIPSDQRRELSQQADYDDLFASYRQNILPQATAGKNEIDELFRHFGRIALTCFEAEPCQCHRSHLADHLSHDPKYELPAPSHL